MNQNISFFFFFCSSLYVVWGKGEKGEEKGTVFFTATKWVLTPTYLISIIYSVSWINWDHKYKNIWKIQSHMQMLIVIIIIFNNIKPKFFTKQTMPWNSYNLFSQKSKYTTKSMEVLDIICEYLFCRKI